MSKRKEQKVVEQEVVVMPIAIVKSGVTFTGKSTVADVENHTVTMRHLSAHPTLGKGKESPKMDLTWTFDFSECSEAEILAMAGEQCVIKQRRIFVKDAAPASENWNGATFNAKELVTVRQTGLAATFKRADSLSADEKLSLIAMLQSDDS